MLDIPENVAALMEAAQHRNLAELMQDGRLSQIASVALDEYEMDKKSMSDWFKRMEKGLHLAKMMRNDKTTPWVGAANVKFPMVTSAALQFNARAFPAIVPSGDVVKAKVNGDDNGGQKANRGKRVSSFMSYQLSSQIEEWEGETDNLLTVLPVVGTMLRKVWFDQAQYRPKVKLCEAGAVIINDKVKSLEDAPRISEEIKLYPYEVEERMRVGTFRRVDLQPDGEDKDGPQMFIEQHRRIDLDEDGYPEPYVVTIHKQTAQIVRLVANFEPEDIRAGYDGVVSISRRDHYAVYHFLPSLDGGFWGTGLGLLLGDISETIDSVINMLLDSGHLDSLGAGFIGAEDFRMKGGSAAFRPGEFKQVSASGADIRQGVVQLQFPGPSPVLFQMLGLLIDAGREVASVKDIADATNSNTPATTTLALIEEGMRVFTAAYKRIWRGLKGEFLMLRRMNAESLRVETYSRFLDIRNEAGQIVPVDPSEDFSSTDMDITPVADPNSVTSAQAMGRGQLLLEMSGTGVVDRGEATRRVLEAAGIDDTEALLPQPDPMQQAQAQHAVFMMQAEQELKKVEISKVLAEIDKMRAAAAKDISEIDKNEAEVLLRDAELRLKALIEGLKDERERLDVGGVGGMAGSPGYDAVAVQSSAGGIAPQDADMGALLVGAGSVPGGQGDAQGGFGYPV